MDAIFFARTDNIVAAIHPDDANRMVDSCTAAESEVTLTMYQADAIVSGPVG
jgi:predicted NAD/FAD-binding protein